MKQRDAAKTKGVMVWSDLWPARGQTHSRGWSEQLPPGLIVLVDETGEEAVHWLEMLTGHAQPGQGNVQCNGLCSQVDHAAYQAQTYWHHPPGSVPAPEMTGQQWLQRVMERWPSWNHDAWSRHCHGFELSAHLSKPLWHLSTGSLRKLGIAAALASEATLTVIEEPVAGLDAQSIQYLGKALNDLGDAMAASATGPRWVIVAHWEPLPGVTWDEVLAPPSLTSSQALSAESVPLQHSPAP